MWSGIAEWAKQSDATMVGMGKAITEYFVQEPCAPEARKVTDHYKIHDELLGIGQYGKVYLGECRATGQKVAVKVIKIPRNLVKKLQAVRREVRLHVRASQATHTVPLLDHFETATTKEIYM